MRSGISCPTVMLLSITTAVVMMASDLSAQVGGPLRLRPAPPQHAAEPSWRRAFTATPPALPATPASRRMSVPVNTISRPRESDSAAVDDLPPIPHSLSVPIAVPESVPRVTIDLERRYRERDSSFQQLKEQLQRLIQEQKSTTPEASAPERVAEPAVVPEDDSPHSPPEPASAAVGHTSADAATSQSGGAVPAAPQSDPPSPPVMAVQKPASVFADSLSAQALIDGPVDRVGLADNLYALQELQIALEMYRQVDVSDLPISERCWVRYQSACCLRRLGQIPEAQEVYRRLAGETEAGWLGKMSRWWLDEMDSRARLETEVEQQRKVLEALAEVVYEHPVE